jgi:serine/threonine protein kinase
MKPIDDLGLNVLNNYHVLKVLGQGSEGTVYLIEDNERLSQLVLKVFHKRRTSDWLPGLPVYAQKIEANDFGLPVITLLYDKDEIIGLTYPFVKLSSLHWRITCSITEVAKSLVGSYCQKQYYLMTKHGLALYDPVVSNLMVDDEGQWHYMDIGGGICLLNDPWVRNHGEIGYGFASMLMSIYDLALHKSLMPIEGYSYEIPCVYCNSEWLSALAMQHDWIQEILNGVRSQKSSIFYNPEFYRQLGERLPSRVPVPFLTLPISTTLTWLGKLRGKVVS